MTNSAAMTLDSITFHYDQRCALDAVSWEVREGELFALLGPNGSGKTTLFRLLATLIPLQCGKVEIFGHSLLTAVRRARYDMGIVFQSPSVDGKLTVFENLRLQASLYGYSGKAARERIAEVASQLGIADRQRDRVDDLSGGLRRRLELAKSLLHQPRLLIMDEPTTGLDPAARSDLWNYLRQLQQQTGMTVFMTTHLLDEAENADRVAILNEGQVVALDDPQVLCRELGADVISIRSSNPESLATALQAEFNLPSKQIGGLLRMEQPDSSDLAQVIMKKFRDQIQTMTLGRPSLEDVFISKTGHQFWHNEVRSGERQ